MNIVFEFFFIISGLRRMVMACSAEKKKLEVAELQAGLDDADVLVVLKLRIFQVTANI